LTIKQQNLEAALRPESRSQSPEPLTHVKQQEELRKETIAAFHTAIDGVDDEDDLLVPREKTKDELEREEEEYQEFLKREVGQDLRELITVDEESSALLVEELEEVNKKKKVKKPKKSEAKSGKSKAEEDQDFLLKCVHAPLCKPHILNLDTTATFLIEDGLTEMQGVSLHTKKLQARVRIKRAKARLEWKK
jgi:protein KRI1